MDAECWRITRSEPSLTSLTAGIRKRDSSADTRCLGSMFSSQSEANSQKLVIGLR